MITQRAVQAPPLMARGSARVSLRYFIESLLARSATEKTLALVVLSLALDVAWLVIFYFSIPSFKKVPEISAPVIDQLFEVFVLAAFILVALVLLGIWLRQARYQGRLYAYLFFTAYAGLCFWVLHLIGTFSTPGLILYMSLPSLILLVYGHREGLYCVIMSTLLLGAVMAAEYSEVLPYAPVTTLDYARLYLKAPIFFTFGFAAIFLTALLFILVWIVRAQLIQKEGALGATLVSLGATQDRLARAGRTVAVGEMAVGTIREIEASVQAARALASALLEEVSGRSRLDLSGRELARFEDDLAQIAAAQRRAQRVLEELDRLSRENGRALFPVNLNALVSDALSQVRRRYPQHPFGVRIDLAAEHPHVMADDIELLWALDNVIENALHSLKSPETTLYLSSRNEGEKLIFACTHEAASKQSPEGGESLGFVYRAVSRLSGKVAIVSGQDGESIIEIIMPVGKIQPRPDVPG